MEVRLIPAHAGKTSSTGRRSRVRGAHPRSRGENMASSLVADLTMGSSPLTRGKQSPTRREPGPRRLIPAHAGKTAVASAATHGVAAHPRSRGENPRAGTSPASRWGSSPLTRGKRTRAACPPTATGLIPAHAGKTGSKWTTVSSYGAHPRSRGENRLRTEETVRPSGSSPLTRGKPLLLQSTPHNRRLIPAHAGKTLPDLRFYCADRSDLGNP